MAAGKPISTEYVRGIFDTNETSPRSPLIVVRPQVLYKHNYFEAQPQGLFFTWAGLLFNRQQGAARAASIDTIAADLLTDPGYSLVYQQHGPAFVLAFTKAVTRQPRPGTQTRTFRQAGVTWAPDSNWPEQRNLPPMFYEAVGAAVYSDLANVDPEAGVEVQGYPGDSRSKERFFERCAGLEPANGPRWGSPGAKLVGHCGTVMAKLVESMPFLAEGQLPWQVAPPNA